MVEISVVIPTYNRSDVIGRAIESALKQTLEEIEVIVVDDASTDSTQEIVTSIDDPRVEYIKHEQNLGGSAARNTGLDHSSGKYIAFLDSDDVWERTKLEKQVSELNSRSDEWIATYCNFNQKRSNILIEAVDNNIRRPTGIEGDERVIDRILLRSFSYGGSSTIFVERAAVDQINGFDPSFQRLQDLEFLIRLLQVGKMSYVDEILVYKYDTGTPETQVTAESMEQFNETFADLIQDLGYKTRVEKIQNFMLAKSYISHGEFKKGLQSLSRSECPHYRDGFGLGLAVGCGIRRSIINKVSVF